VEVEVEHKVGPQIKLETLEVLVVEEALHPVGLLIVEDLEFVVKVLQEVKELVEFQVVQVVVEVAQQLLEHRQPLKHLILIQALMMVEMEVLE
tara:strand:+ start:361 stop:639 length:279 start_codon:yes stop_codon:yes gene_type:complete